MWFERVKSAVQESFPGAMVNVEINERHLTIGVIGTGNDRKTATSMLYGALNKIGATAHFFTMVMNLHKSREDWILLELRRLTGGEISVRVFGTTLEISVYSPFNFSVDKQLEPILSELMNVYGASRICINYPNRMSFRDVPFSYDGDDDDSTENPNWPSKTGNPSGGGRGNNPPHR